MPNKKQNRREFLKSGIAGIAGAVIVVMIPKPSAFAREDKDDAGGDDYDWYKHYYAYVIDTTKCIGCGNCVRACKRENNVVEQFFRTWVEQYRITEDNHVYVDSPKGGFNGFEHIPVKEKVVKGFFVPKICNHCRKTPCTQVCPVHASYQSPDGVILIDKKRCIGCGYCVQACPYGSRYIDPRTHTADKCTWCYHRITKGLLPACVASCPTATRRFGDMKKDDSEIKELIEKNRVNVLKPNLNTKPFCFYIGMDESVR